MPTYTRRDFLRSSLPLAAASLTVPQFLSHTVLAAPGTENTLSIPGQSDNRILVVLQLSGGNDGLNTLVPYEDARYFNLRPQLALRPRDVLRINDQLGLHPSLNALHNLYDEGEVAWIQNVGYPNPNRSHFRSMEIWHTGSTEKRKVNDGWLGRYLDAQCSGADPCPPTAAVTIGTELPQALRTPDGGSTGVVIEDPEAYVWKPSGRSSTQDARQQELFARQAKAGLLGEGPSPRIDFLRRTAVDAALSAEWVDTAVSQYRSGVTYPNSRLGRDMRRIGQFIAGGLRSRVFYVRHGGFDTHANQAGTHARLLQQVGEGLAAFRKDMIRQGQWERVTVLGFSEFGRRVAENDSAGTDHGAAAPMFLLGQGVKGGLLGDPPDLGKLVNGDVPHAIDFRSVYGSVLDQWLQLDSAKVLGKRYPALPLFV
jgi:uncharacterized protein (DUF1501 family)